MIKQYNGRMIIITGGAGFIGSNMVETLNNKGIQNIMIVDNDSTKHHHFLSSLSFTDFIDKQTFISSTLPQLNATDVQAIIHLGACSSTTEQNVDFLTANNTEYSITLAQWCIANNIRFIYASSAATYGDGKLGFDDTINIDSLQPLNHYGWSKQHFDIWAKQHNHFNKIVGLKFFNVYGKYENYKGPMQSMVGKATQQIKDTGGIKLFKSHHPDYTHGNQVRDFIYINDCTQIMSWLLNHPDVNGLFNCGSGIANTWNSLANGIFKALNVPPNIEYIDMPNSVRNQYQYYTKATMSKLAQTGCPMPQYSLDDGIADYMQQISQ